MSDKKRGGRPRLDDQRALRSTVTVSVPAPMHDRLIVTANRMGLSVSTLVRRIILTQQQHQATTG